MSRLAHLLSHWRTHCSPTTRETLIQCMCKQTLTFTPLTYRVEAAGSGTILSHCTKHELQTWFNTHQLFLGHGGVEITNINQIPQDFQGPFVALKNVFQGRLHKTIHKHSNIIEWSPDSQTFICSSNARKLSLWTKNGDMVIETIRLQKNYTCIEWNPNGQSFVCGLIDGDIILWTRDDRQTKTLNDHTWDITCIAWSPNGQTFVSGSHDGTNKLWTKHGKLIQTFTGHGDYVWRVDWSPDGTTFVSTSVDCAINMWTKNGDLIKILDSNFDAVCVEWSPDSNLLVCATDFEIGIWTKAGSLVNKIKDDTMNFPTIKWISDSASFYVVDEQHVKLRRETGNLVREHTNCLDLAFGFKWNPHDEGFCGTYGYCGKNLVWWTSFDDPIITHEEEHEQMKCIEWSPSEHILASCSNSTTIKIWSQRGVLLKTLCSHTTYVDYIAWSPDGQILASTSASRDGTIKLWK